jgi:hypothetical protein
MWSIGTIVVELVLRVPFLAGDSDIDQLKKTFHAMGSPTEQDWPVSTSIYNGGPAFVHNGPCFGFGAQQSRPSPLSLHPQGWYYLARLRLRLLLLAADYSDRPQQHQESRLLGYRCGLERLFMPAACCIQPSPLSSLPAALPVRNLL